MVRGRESAFSVMTGLVPVIHAAPLPANPKVSRRLDDVDDRDKPGTSPVMTALGSYPSAYGDDGRGIVGGRRAASDA